VIQKECHRKEFTCSSGFNPTWKWESLRSFLTLFAMTSSNCSELWLKSSYCMDKDHLYKKFEQSPAPQCYGFSLVWSGWARWLPLLDCLPSCLPCFISLHVYHFYFDHLTAYRECNPLSSHPFYPFLDDSAATHLRATSCTSTVHSWPFYHVLFPSTVFYHIPQCSSADWGTFCTILYCSVHFWTILWLVV
jgi:hypothetical protein